MSNFKRQTEGTGELKTLEKEPVERRDLEYMEQEGEKTKKQNWI